MDAATTVELATEPMTAVSMTTTQMLDIAGAVGIICAIIGAYLWMSIAYGQWRERRDAQRARQQSGGQVWIAARYM